jgi:hypothetical protein
MLSTLRDRLLEIYPAEHPAIILYSSGTPEYESLGRKLAISELAAHTVPVYSNLWVPSLSGPAIEAVLAPLGRDGSR